MIYDLVILGGGPAGLEAAKLAGKQQLQVLVIEKEKIGGICLHEGCIPTKLLLHCAKIYSKAKNGKNYGVVTEDIRYDFATVLKRKTKVLRKLENGLKSQMKLNNVETMIGKATILSQDSNGVVIDVDGMEVVGRHLLVATGSSAILPNIKGLYEGIANKYVGTNKEFLDADKFYEDVVIIGGGTIGIEMAFYYSMLGSKVTILEKADEISKNIDQDIREAMKKTMEKKGIKYHTDADVLEILPNSVVFEVAGNQEVISSSYTLICTGRKANVEGLGLEKIGVQFDGKGIKIDDFGQTNVSNVYSAGDVTGKIMLAHAAYKQAEIAVNHMLDKETEKMAIQDVPYVIYSSPEIAGVGETEYSAKLKGIDYEAQIIPMQFSGRFAAENENGYEICKILIDKTTKNLIGVHMISDYASEIIYGCGVLIKKKMNVEEIEKIIFPHPSVSEIIKEGISKFS